MKQISIQKALILSLAIALIAMAYYLGKIKTKLSPGIETTTMQILNAETSATVNIDGPVEIDGNWIHYVDQHGAKVSYDGGRIYLITDTPETLASKQKAIDKANRQRVMQQKQQQRAQPKKQQVKQPGDKK